MPEPRPSIRDFIKNGHFTTRNLNTMPEEDRRRDSSSTIDSEPSDPPSRRYSSEIGNNVAGEGSVMLMPLDLGIDGLEPDCYLAATPSIITYTVGRGYSSVRMEEIDLPHSRPLPTIAEIPEYPTIAPPPNFDPIQGYHSGSEYNTANNSSSQLVRQGSHSSQPLPSSRSQRSTGSNRDGEAEPPTSPWSLSSPNANMPPMPSQFTPYPSDEKLSSSHRSWPLPDPMEISPDGTPRDAAPPYSSPTSSMQDSKEMQAFKSRFSWCDAEDKKRSWVQRWVHDWFLLELTCLCFAAIFMVVICILMAYFDGSEVAQARTFGVSLNATIAILAAFARICLFFPTAEVLGQIKWWFSNAGKRVEDLQIKSRGRQGPLDSIQLLARTKRITWGSIIGAMLLLALPMDFFFQQLIHMPAVWLPSGPGNGTMSRSVNYSPALTTATVNGSTILYPEPVLESSLIPFVAGGGRNVPLDFDCPTNNCTFQPFWTVALDSQCTEMPATLLRQSCETGPAQWMPSAPTIPVNGTYVQGTSCGWYIDGVDPSGSGNPLPILMSGYSTLNNSKGVALAGRMLPLRDIITKKPILGDFTSFNFQNIAYPVGDFLVSSTPDGSAGAYNNNTPVVHECVVYWAAKKLQVSVFEGKTTQKVLDTKVLPYSGDPALPYILSASSGKFNGNYSMTLQDQGNTTLFSVDSYTARGASITLEEIAASSWYALNDTSPLLVKWIWASSGAAKVTPVPSEGDPTWLASSVAGLSDHLTGLITSMNHVIWQTENAKTQKTDALLGQAWRQTVVVQPQWIWIAVPGALLLFSLIFLVVTIMRNSGNNDGLGVWRTAAMTVKVKKKRKNRSY